MKDEEIKSAVRDKYGKVATQGGGCCSCSCGDTLSLTKSKAMGYSDKQIASIPEDANLGLGCGNPTALASLQEGEVVMDLGSGAGIDCFLAAKAVGADGKVIGVDMTPEMLAKARSNAKKGSFGNVEFRLGEIEHLPVADASVDVIISNCVINLSTDKNQVFNEAYRALKPGGRLMVSDIVLLKELPAAIKNDANAWSCCIGGASQKDDYLSMITTAGFKDVKAVSNNGYHLSEELSDVVASVNVSAFKR